MNSNLFPGEQELSSAKILIIDDEDVYIHTLEWALRQAKFSNFRSLTDSTKAREEFERFQPDLVLLDLNMPGLDGFAVLQQFRESAAAGDFLPVLILTSDSTGDTRRRAMAAGATDFLGKPVDYTELILRIKNLLQTRFLYQQAQTLQTQIETLTATKGAKDQTQPD
jgi:DNA-binding response OmpR family regulator